MAWYENWKKAEQVQFNTIFQILKKYLADGMQVHEFMLDLMAMITTVSEDEWGTWKDPSKLKQKENTLRGYTKRSKISKKIATRVVHHLCLDGLKERIDALPPKARELMADEVSAYASDVNASNVSDVMCQIMEDHVQTVAGLIKQDDLERQAQEALDKDLKSKYGRSLLIEEDNQCPFPGCGKSLVVEQGGSSVDKYEVCMIEKDGSQEFDNLLAMCPDHHATYILDNRKPLAKQLKAIKKALVSQNTTRTKIDKANLSAELPRILKNINKAIDDDDKEPSNYDPKCVEQKIDKAKERRAYRLVHNLVIENFEYVHTVMRRLEKQNIINMAELQLQMRGLYIKASKNQKDKLQIFETIVDRVKRASKCSASSCEIFVAYFVQICEVFDASTK